MKSRILTAAMMLAVATGTAAAQNGPQPNDAPKVDTTATAGRSPLSMVPAITIQHIRPQDKRGLHMFESPKDDNIAYNGFKLDFGAAFTQQFQDLDHSNTSTAVLVAGKNTNELIGIGKGFNNAVANLYLNAQLAPGIRVSMTSYLSSRHHNETWVKDGYIMIDESPIDVAALNTIMKYTTLKVGHFEVNYGDSHFRRSDNGNAMHNPFVGNLILDPFTTEIGGEVYLRSNGFLAMAAVTGGEIKGQVAVPEKRSPSLITKLGFDKQLTSDLRVRLMGSAYTTKRSASNTLYSGDRAGSRYYDVLENTTSTEAAQKSSGMVTPGFGLKVTAFQVNPFVKFHGLEAFGVIETATGRGATEKSRRTIDQLSVEGVYRFLQDEKLFVGARYNTVSGELAGAAFKDLDIKVQRTQLSGGWFVTPVLMLKGEYVSQKYLDFPTTDIRNGGKFKGFMMEGVVAF
ncbi:MAG: hypothetical protein ABIV28_05710 [Longimicrobiales bacterium]